MEAVRGHKSRFWLAALGGGVAALAAAGTWRRVRPRTPKRPRTEERYRAIYDQAAVGIERVDIRTGRLLEVNPQLCRMLDYECPELLAKSFAEITLPEDLPAEQKLLARLLAGEIPNYSVEKRYLKRDGSPLWVRVTSSLTSEDEVEPFRISIVEDISQRKRAEVELRRSQELVENARDFALFMLDPQGRVTSWNIGAERLFGWKRDEVLGRDGALIYTPEDRARGIPDQELHSARQHGYGSDERWHVRKNGERFYVSGSVWPTYDETGGMRGFVKVGRDVTQRKRLEEDLARARNELEEAVARRTAELTQTVHQLEMFSYSLSHDMRAPLRSIHSYLEIVHARAHGVLPAETMDLLDRATRSAQRLDDLIRDVLTYHRTTQERVDPHPVDPERVLDQMLGESFELDPARLDLVVQRPLLPVQANEALLTQCLSNLLLNAVRFVPEGRKPEVRVWTEPREGRVRLWVADNGIGIARDDQPAIWEIFRRLHPDQFAGTGIGLAIVRKAAERMGGSVGVESEPGRGSKFWLELPAVK